MLEKIKNPAIRTCFETILWYTILSMFTPDLYLTVVSYVNTFFYIHHTRTTIFRIWLISLRNWSSSSLRLPSITVFMLLMLSWTVENPSRVSRFTLAISSCCWRIDASRRVITLFSKCCKKQRFALSYLFC